ncbi:MAG: response regulator [Pirellulales bacterium]|nr:response regulator [Pirellulales bacterium]
MGTSPAIRKILLADDSRLCRELLKDGLLGREIAIFEANDGQEALDLVARDLPDLILLDVQMPVRNGLSVLRELQADERTRRIPVIMLTGQGNETVAVEAMKEGAKDYLVKGSVTPDTLDRAIANAVRQSTLDRELNAKQDEVDWFATVAEGDLRQPLEAILDSCQTLRAECRGKVGPASDRAIDAIADAAIRMRQFLESLSTGARADAPAAESTPVDLGDVLAAVTADLRPAIEAAGARIDLGAMPTLPGDRAALTRLFRSLLENALKHRGSQPPTIVVTAEQDEGTWHLAVRDNGAGIDPRDHARLLAPESARGTPAEGGAGLGVCNAIIQRHGGHFWIDSAVGRGSTFHVMLPAGDPLPQETAPRSMP